MTNHAARAWVSLAVLAVVMGLLLFRGIVSSLAFGDVPRAR